MKQTIPYCRQLPASRSKNPVRAFFCAMDSFLRDSFSNAGRIMVLPFALLLCIGSGIAQNCPNSGNHTQSTNENTYYPGTTATVAVGATSITLGAAGSGANFSNTPIAAGDLLLIIQMQGAQINSANSSSYGSGYGVMSGSGFTATNMVAGNMEFVVANSAVPLAGGTLTLLSGTTNSYTNSAYGANGQYTYQIIRVPSFFNIQLTAAVNTPLWNGSVGGVTVVNAINQLDFNGQTINAQGAGFRGGAGRSLNGAVGTLKTDYRTMSTTNANASKGEGIAGTPRYVNNNGVLLDNGVEGYPNGSYARGAAGNAGGGATDSDPTSNDQNAGGGGGSNGNIGGWGGNGWFSFGATGGRGGQAFYLQTGPFTPYYSPSRLIMGGGGGAGTTNNGSGSPAGGFASSGASGGGIVIVNATKIIGTGTINASGATANSSVTVDGSGGGGGGGSILIYANSGHAGVTAIANGGDGGSNNPASGGGATQHGPGGSGGGGVIFSNANLNAATSVNGGNAGISIGTNNTSHYGADSVAHNGVLTQTVPLAQLPVNMTKCQSLVILPVTLVDFSAAYANSNAALNWVTSQEIDLDYFEIQRSSDAVHFTVLGQTHAEGSPGFTQNYSYNDYLGAEHEPVVYYRLRIVDINGRYTYSKMVSIRLDQSTDTKISIYPNPAADYAVLKLYATQQTTATMRLMDNTGKQILVKNMNVNIGNNSLLIDQLNILPKGIYIMQVFFQGSQYTEKLVKQ